MTIRNKIKILLFMAFFALPVHAFAADGGAVTFSVSPPLFKINMKPGENWSSFVKVINNNPYPVSVYADLANFKSSDSGGVEFIKDDGSSEYGKYMLSQWMSITKSAINIPSFSSVDVPFSIMLTANADPGGHYAAILLGNKPIDEVGGNVIKFSSKIASLLLVKVDGEIKEKGDVVEFSNDKTFNNNLEANFSLRFANQGNVHIHPEGQIKIYNLFGEERGNIEINRSQGFGNVLPESEKRWQFNWQGSNGVLDAGLMRAELLLTYGDAGKQTVQRKIYFWTIDLKPTLIVLGTLLLAIFMIIWLIRRYIRKSVETMRAQMSLPNKARAARGRSQTVSGRRVRMVAGATQEIKKESILTKIMNWSLLKKSFSLSLSVVISIILLALYVFHEKYGFFNDNYVPEDPRSVVIKPKDEPVSATSTAASSTAASAAASQIGTSTETLSNRVSVINGSNQRDLGTRIKGLLIANNIDAEEATSTDVVYDDIAVVIKFNQGQLQAAQGLDALLNGQAELRQESTADGRIEVMLGNRFK